MADKTWKAHERRIAEKLAGQRIPCSGNGAIAGDVLHDELFIECKYTSRKFGPRTWLLKAKEQSPPDKIPIVVVREKSKRDEVVIMGMDDFVKLFGRKT